MQNRRFKDVTEIRPNPLILNGLSHFFHNESIYI